MKAGIAASLTKSKTGVHLADRGPGLIRQTLYLTSWLRFLCVSKDRNTRRNAQVKGNALARGSGLGPTREKPGPNRISVSAPMSVLTCWLRCEQQLQHKREGQRHWHLDR